MCLRCCSKFFLRASFAVLAVITKAALAAELAGFKLCSEKLANLAELTLTAFGTQVALAALECVWPGQIRGGGRGDIICCFYFYRCL